MGAKEEEEEELDEGLEEGRAGAGKLRIAGGLWRA